MSRALKIFCGACWLADVSAQAAPQHRCSADAATQAKRLLTYYLRLDDVGSAGPLAIEDDVHQAESLAAIRGERRYDVFEVWGRVYKGVIECASSMPRAKGNAL